MILNFKFYVLFFVFLIFVSACSSDQVEHNSLELPAGCGDSYRRSKVYLSGFEEELREIGKNLELLRVYVKKSIEDVESLNEEIGYCVFLLYKNSDFYEHVRKEVLSVHREILRLLSVLGVYDERLEEDDVDVDTVFRNMMHMLK